MPIVQNDGRWDRLKHGLRIEGEISDFEKRLVKAREGFRVRVFTMTIFNIDNSV